MTFDANLCPALSSGVVVNSLAQGLGDRGFRSAELRLLGPGTVLLGAGLTLVRILLCLVSSSACLARLRSWLRSTPRSESDSETLISHRHYGPESHR